MPRLSTDIGPHEEKRALPFGLDGYVVIRRRHHPSGGGRQFDALRDAETRRYMRELQAAQERVKAADPDTAPALLTAPGYLSIKDDVFGAFLHARGEVDHLRKELTDCAASLVKTWGGPCFGDQQPGKKVTIAKVKAAFFGEAEAEQTVPRFETVDGLQVEDGELVAEASGIVAIHEDAIHEKRTGTKITDLKEFNAFEEKHRQQMTAALEKLGVRLSEYGGQPLDIALRDWIIKTADEIERTHQAALGF